MSQINVDDINSQSTGYVNIISSFGLKTDVIAPRLGTSVYVSGVEIDAISSSKIKIGQNINNTLGSNTLAVGSGCFTSASTGTNNTGIGNNALRDNTSGEYNTALSHASLLQNTTGSENTAIGFGTLLSSNGSQNVAVGVQAGGSLTTGSNNVLIGYGSDTAASTTNNSITLGNSSHNILRCAVTSITSLSDARDKKNIEESTYGLDFVDSLKPVKFEWDTRDGAKKDIKDLGFIAQDLKEVDDEYLGLVYSENPDKLEASYGKLIPILVKAIQELSEEVKQLKSK
jgi:hypothetical protein